jgi:hypothetical protein
MLSNRDGHGNHRARNPPEARSLTHGRGPVLFPMLRARISGRKVDLIVRSVRQPAVDPHRGRTGIGSSD